MMKTERKYLGILLLAILTCSFFESPGRRPPGTIRVKYNGEYLYVDKNPINEFDYHAFLWHLKHEDSLSNEQLFYLLPDTIKYSSYNDFMHQDKPPYERLDPVYLSDTLKQLYAQWRTKEVKIVLYVNFKKEYNFVYEVLPPEEYYKICQQNRKLKYLPDEEKYTRCIVR